MTGGASLELDLSACKKNLESTAAIFFIDNGGGGTPLLYAETQQIIVKVHKLLKADFSLSFS